MVIDSVRLTELNNKARLSAEITFDGTSKKLAYFEVDSKWKSFICPDASAFLAALLFSAMKTNEPLNVRAAVSKGFFDNCGKVINLVKGWGLSLMPIEINADVLNADNFQPAGQGLFFSGGVDSFYSFLKHKETSNDKITHFIFVRGFDLTLKDTALYQQVIGNLRAIAKAEMVEIIEVVTNIRQFNDCYMAWDYTHGGCLAAVALFLRRGLNKVYFSGAIPKAALRPYGIHPDLDALWSTETLKIVHEGMEADRLAKVLNLVSKSPLALKHLRVCWQNRRDQYNCCECEKCLRTMLSLYNAGVLDKCQTFPKPINLKTLKKLYLFPNQVRYFKENLDMLKANRDTSGLIEAIETCLTRNANRTKFNKLLFKLRHKIGQFDAKYLSSFIFKNMSKYGWI